MTILFERIRVRTAERMEFYDITGRALEVLGKTGIRDGFMNVMPLHTTTSLFLSEFREMLLEDVKAFLARLASSGEWYRHNSSEFSDCERRNAVSHLRGLLLSSNPLTLQIHGGELTLGEFQRIIFAELDGPRERILQIQVVGE